MNKPIELRDYIKKRAVNRRGKPDIALAARQLGVEYRKLWRWAKGKSFAREAERHWMLEKGVILP